MFMFENLNKLRNIKYIKTKNYIAIQWNRNINVFSIILIINKRFYEIIYIKINICKSIFIIKKYISVKYVIKYVLMSLFILKFRIGIN